MDKQEWISHKIAKLIKEGYSQSQAAAISYSMYEKSHKQQGGSTDWWNTFTNPNINLQAQTLSPQQNFQYAPQTMGTNIQGSLGRPQQESIGQIIPQGISSMQTTPDLSGIQKSAQYNQPQNLTWESTQKPKQVTGDEWQRYKLANIYGSGLGTSEALAMTGKYAGEGNTGMAVGAGVLSALKGTRDFLTGYGAGKTNQRTYEDYLKSIEKDQPYNYLSETPLQATAQQGGSIPNGTMSYQTSMQPVYNKAVSGEQGLNQLDYYKMLMQSSQTPFVNPPQQPDLSQQVYQQSFVPLQDVTANDYLNAQNRQQGGYSEDVSQQSTQQPQSDVTNAQMMTGAFITDVGLQKPTNPDHLQYYGQLKDKKITGYVFNPNTQQYEVEYE